MPHGVGSPPFGQPGITPLETQLSGDFLTDNEFIRERGIWIPADAEDSLNTPVTTLRAGLMLVRAEAGTEIGLYVPMTHADAPLAAAMKDAVILSYFVNMFGGGSVLEKKNVAAVKMGFGDLAKIFFDGAAAPEIDKAKLILTKVHFEE